MAMARAASANRTARFCAIHAFVFKTLRALSGRRGVTCASIRECPLSGQAERRSPGDYRLLGHPQVVVLVLHSFPCPAIRDAGRA